MNVLVVGAGAVGQVFGRHLQRGGAEIAFLVRERYAAAYRQAREDGLPTYPLNEGYRREPAPLRGFGVLTGMDEVAARRWDQVWLTVSSNALRGAWLDDLVASAGPATFVALPPEGDRAALLAHVPEAQLVSGYITFLSWQAPLPGQALEAPGVMYWFPPLLPCLFSGPAARAVVEPLRRGGMPARLWSDVSGTAATVSSILMPTVAALECARWSFRALLGGPWLGVAAAASREALAITAAHYGLRLGVLRVLTQRSVLWLVLTLARAFTPFDFEAYMAFHFKKVGAQTRYILDTLLARSRRYGLASASIERLAAHLEQAAGP